MFVKFIKELKDRPILVGAETNCIYLCLNNDYVKLFSLDLFYFNKEIYSFGSKIGFASEMNVFAYFDTSIADFAEYYLENSKNKSNEDPISKLIQHRTKSDIQWIGQISKNRLLILCYFHFYMYKNYKLTKMFLGGYKRREVKIVKI